MAKAIAEALVKDPTTVQESQKWPFDTVAKKVAAFEAMIYPEFAAHILAQEDPNRPKSVGTIEAYARRMGDNKWSFNGEAVKFAKNGALLDGQHRLEACMKSGMPFRTLVVVGLEPESQDTMDDPRKRTVNNQQILRGLNFPASASAAARWLLLLRLGTIGHARRATNSEVLDVLIKHRALAESALLLKDKDAVMLPSILVTLHYIGTHLLMLPEKANSYVDVMTSGVPAYEGDPVHAWREYVSKAIRTGHSVPARLQWHGAVHAWNLFTNNQSVRRFTVPEETQIENLDVRQI